MIHRAVALRFVLTALPIIALMWGCATVACTPVSIVVAKKEERLVSELQHAGVRSTPTGGVEPIERQVPVRQFWVESTDRHWFRITEAEYEVATPDRALQVCR